MLHVYFQRWCIRGSEDEPGTAEEIGQLLFQSGSFPTIWSTNITSAQSDLLFIIRTLQVIADPSPLFLPSDKRRERSDPPKSEEFNEWFSHEMAQCLASESTPIRVRLYALDVFTALFMRGLHSVLRKTYAKCFLACAYGMGYTPPPGQAALTDTSDRPEEALGPMLSQMTRTVSMQLQANVGLDPLHVTFAWELMEPLTQLCEFGSYREVLRSKNIHHLMILLCRTVLQEQAARKPAISMSDRQWPWLDSWIRLGIFSTSPSRPLDEQFSSSVKLFKEDGFKKIWQCHYGNADKEYLIHSDFDWMVYVMREARTSPSTYSHGSTKLYFPRTVVYCMTMLCEVPDVANESRRKRLYSDVSWAMKTGGVLGHAGLKLARALCGRERDVAVDSMRSVISGFRPFVNLSQTLSLLLATYYQSSDDFYGIPESYLLHMAYLDILSGILQLNDGDFPSVLAAHMDNCFSVASLMRSNSHEWDESELHMMRLCLGRHVDDRPWKLSFPASAIDQGDSYPNTFIRDIWFRLEQFFSKYLLHCPLPDAMRTEEGILIGLKLSCSCWQIYDTHPLPDEALSTMTRLLQEVLDLPHDEVAEFDRQIEIQRAFRRVSQVIQHDELHLAAETKTAWCTARDVLRHHIDISVETLEPPLTALALSYDDNPSATELK
ncbi:hypothetical protein EIP91_004786 [Steccherinum ochraceum]|uniref:Uncharacterized protein n=1 Tax=Steccherinum ochraceum TaxID=92696 RepID=A0A4V2MVX4_9APHY|nr:hypothetical protein EIP91_004786 [Steccherinum ochraceum]